MCTCDGLDGVVVISQHLDMVCLVVRAAQRAPVCGSRMCVLFSLSACRRNYDLYINKQQFATISGNFLVGWAEHTKHTKQVSFYLPGPGCYPVVPQPVATGVGAQ